MMNMAPGLYRPPPGYTGGRFIKSKPFCTLQDTRAESSTHMDDMATNCAHTQKVAMTPSLQKHCASRSVPRERALGAGPRRAPGQASGRTRSIDALRRLQLLVSHLETKRAFPASRRCLQLVARHAACHQLVFTQGVWSLVLTPCPVACPWPPCCCLPNPPEPSLLCGTSDPTTCRLEGSRRLF